MNNNNIIWTEKLLQISNEKSLDELIEWCGVITETRTNHNQDLIYFIKPFNLNIDKIIINLDSGVLDRIGIFGIDFLLPFNFIRSKFVEFKRTFNTYDSIDDEQFIFYPANVGGNLNACDSWIPEELQKLQVEDISFKKISFYFSKNKIPYHFRDGWHLIDPEKYPK